jgi:hypothetical protein
MDVIPVWLFFVATLVIVTLAVEAGYRSGTLALRRAEGEKEAPVSAIAGAILALLAFVLAFTFSIVSGRYDARKALVREEANAIGTAYLRADFLPEPDRSTAQALFRDYVDLRVNAAHAATLDQVRTYIAESDRIQERLWDMRSKMPARTWIPMWVLFTSRR